MPGNARSGRFGGWISLERFLHILDRQLEPLRVSGFVLEDELTLERRREPRALLLRGRVRCIHGLFVDVRLTMATKDERARAVVRILDYSYHAGIEGSADRPIFRYDNAHDYPHHADAHHKHHFDHATWKRLDPPEWIGEADCPQPIDVLYELEDWWRETGQHLDLGED